MTGTGCNKGNDAKMVRQQARMEKRDADYQEKQSRRAMRYTASPQALHAIQPTLAYCEKMREQYSLLKKMEGVNDRALEIQDEYKVLINKLDSALQEGKVEKAQHVAKQINKRAKEHKHLKQDFHRFRDDYAANVNYWGIATGVLLPTTIILGAYCIYQSMQSHGTNNQTTPGADKPYLPPPDHEFTVDHENGTIAMDGDVVAHVNILKTTNATFLLGEKNYQDHKKFLDDKYNATGLDGIQLTFHEDG